ncbi:MAG: hypothetical protein AMXMBFR46_00800 [Acidimicrobiia bacterium]
MVVFDTGALIALERNDRAVTVLVAEARRTNGAITVPAGCVAQAWRDPRRQARLAAFLRLPNVDVVALDAGDARRVGLLLASSETRDVVDAHVALCALRGGGAVLTSDPDDLLRITPELAVHAV